MGSPSSSGSSQQEQQQASAPWGPQQGYQLAGLQSDATNYQNQQNLGGYTGEFVAGNNPTLQSASAYGAGVGNGAGQDPANNAFATNGALQGAAPAYLNNAQQTAEQANQGPNAGLYNSLYGYGSGQQSTQGANAGLSSALNSAAMSGAAGLQGFQNTLQSVANQGLANPTSQIEQNAQTYANAPQVQQSENAVNAQIGQTLNQQTLPQLNQQEAAQGNLNSSRAGMAQSEAQGQAATAEGSADASIANNAYNTGMGTASSLYSSGLNSATSAGMFGYNDLANNANTQAQQQIGLNEFNTGTQLGAANSGLNQNVNYMNEGLQANSQIGSAAGMGLTAGQTGLADATANYGLLGSAGTLQQTEQQAGDTNAYDQWNQQANLPQQQLAQYWNVAGPNLGSSVDSSMSGLTGQTQSQSLAGNALGGVAGLVGAGQQSGLFGNLAGTPGNGTLFSGSGLFGSNGSVQNFLGTGIGSQAVNSDGSYGALGNVLGADSSQYLP